MNVDLLVSNWEGDLNALKELLKRMQERLKDRADEIQEAVNNLDAASVCFIVHKCKFSAKFTFANAMITQIDRIEDAYQQNNIDLTFSLANGLIEQMGIEAAEISEFCK